MDLSGFQNLSKKKKQEDDEEYLTPAGLQMLGADFNPYTAYNRGPSSIDAPYTGNPTQAMMDSQGPLANTYMQSRFGMDLPSVRQRIRAAQDQLLQATATPPEPANPMMSAVAMMLANMGNVVQQSRYAGIAGGIGAGLGNAGVGMLAYGNAKAQNDEMMRQWQMEQAKQAYQNAVGEFNLNMGMAPTMEQALGREMGMAAEQQQNIAAVRSAQINAQNEALKENRMWEQLANDKEQTKINKAKLLNEMYPVQQEIYKTPSFWSFPFTGSVKNNEDEKTADIERKKTLTKMLDDEAKNNSFDLGPAVDRALEAAKSARSIGSLGENTISNSWQNLMAYSGDNPEIKTLKASMYGLAPKMRVVGSGTTTEEDMKAYLTAIGNDAPVSVTIGILEDMKKHLSDPIEMQKDMDQYTTLHGYVSGFTSSRADYLTYRNLFTDANKDTALKYGQFIRKFKPLARTKDYKLDTSTLVFSAKNPNLIQMEDEDGVPHYYDLRSISSRTE